MRTFCWLLGNFLIAASVIGAAVVFLPIEPPSASSSGQIASAGALGEALSMPTVVAETPTPVATVAPQPAVAEAPTDVAQQAAEARDTWAAEAPPAPAPTPEPTVPALPAFPLPAPQPRLPITRVVLPRIKLEADVVPSKLVDHDGVLTWEVPAFKAGHADSTAGPGQAGTALIFGHVVTLHSGNVFENLIKAKVGDDIQVFSDDQEFLYRVTSVTSVPRDDTSVLDPSVVPAIDLITCTGAWNPVVWDYMERLVVHADLVPPTP